MKETVRVFRGAKLSKLLVRALFNNKGVSSRGAVDRPSKKKVID